MTVLTFQFHPLRHRKYFKSRMYASMFATHQRTNKSLSLSRVNVGITGSANLLVSLGDLVSEVAARPLEFWANACSIR